MNGHSADAEVAIFAVEILLVASRDALEIFVENPETESINGFGRDGVDLNGVKVGFKIATIGSVGCYVNAPSLRIFKGELAVIDRAGESLVRVFFTL